MIGRPWRYCCGRCGTMTDGHREGGIEHCTACGGVLDPKDEIANVRRERWKLPEAPKESHMARADDLAFPAVNNMSVRDSGLTVREWMAGQAMIGLLASESDSFVRTNAELALRAFEIADAMIAESEKKALAGREK